MGVEIFLGAVWGTVLGLLYFGGLWLTVRQVPRAVRPRLLLLLSFIVRVAAAMAGFMLVLQQGPVMFAATVLSFFLLRFLMTGLLGRPVRERAHAN